MTLPAPKDPALADGASLALLADIGGTNVRFALVDAKAPAPLCDERIRQYEVANFPNLQDAARQYLSEMHSPRPDSAVFAVAGRIDGDIARITNHPWTISREETRVALGLSRVRLVNDFAAQAMAITLLTPDDVSVIGAAAWTPAPDAGRRMYAVIGPGTGLGTGGLMFRDGRAHALESEGGHASFPPGTPEEIRILENLSAQFGRVSNERLVCGPGLVNIHRALCELEGAPVDEAFRPRDVTAGADAAKRRHRARRRGRCPLPAHARCVLRGVRRDRRRPGADPGRVGRGVPDRRTGAADVAAAAALRFSPALRAQGTILRGAGRCADRRRAASATRAAGRGGIRAPSLSRR
jgi:glucokinase